MVVVVEVSAFCWGFFCVIIYLQQVNLDCSKD
nr:MAG TPA: hypothetical protein [Caudoviricetes sp.]